MNIEHLDRITPELINELHGSIISDDDAHVAYLVMKHSDAVIAALHAALRLKRELEGTAT